MTAKNISINTKVSYKIRYRVLALKRLSGLSIED